MSDIVHSMPPTIGRKLTLLIAALLVAVAMCAAAASGPVTQAKAANFCEYVSLGPYGGGQDRCYAWPWESGALAFVGVNTFERAGCISYAPANSGTILASWFCVGNNSEGHRFLPQDGQIRRGVIRNNNLSYSGRFTGWDNR
jgi:hypothetical protein